MSGEELDILYMFVFAESIVNLLIENGADCIVENRRRQTPFMVAHNIRVARLLSEAAKRYKVSYCDIECKSIQL